jgi:DNA polymerase-1
MNKARAEYNVPMTLDEAARHRETFFKTYPGVARWHRQIANSRCTETRTLLGRRVLVGPDDFYGGKANYVIQGTAADGIKQALALLWERRHECPDALLIWAVHDEIGLEVGAGQAEAAAAWLKSCMIDGMQPLLYPLPVQVEITISQTWAGN